MSHQLAATGWGATPIVQGYSTQTSFDTTVASTKAGISFNAGTGTVATVQKVEVTADNL
jgi:hypothetical protein